MNNIWRTIFSSIVCSVVTGAMVFGVTVLDVVGPMRQTLTQNSDEIVHLQTNDSEQRAMIAADRQEFGSRLSSIANLLSEEAKSTGELITLLKLQNQINNQK